MNDMRILESGLIPIYEQNGENAVDARELHEFLRIGKKYTDWIKYRIDQYGFVEGNDFITVLGKSSGGRPTSEYVLTMDMAKELAMVENNEQGRKARKYFIEVDKRYRKMMSVIEKKPHLVGLEKELIATQYATEILKVNEGSKIVMLERVYQNHNIPTNSLPAYTDERITKSLTALLKGNGCSENARVVNKLLQMEGYQEQKTRPSTKTKDKTKKFWSLTTKGLEYGKNLINPHNQKETQPHFYADTFAELMRQIEVL